LLDTSAVLAALDPREEHHERCWEALNSFPPPRVLSPFVLAELDYFVLTRLGHAAEQALLEDVRDGVYQLVRYTPALVEEARAVIQRFSDLNIGLTDASIVVLASMYQVAHVLTLDRRHFSALRLGSGEPFALSPA
jgi:predicted nucleic acid-binding protein